MASLCVWTRSYKVSNSHGFVMLAKIRETHQDTRTRLGLDNDEILAQACEGRVGGIGVQA
jgi:hypothetical protein